MMTGAAAMAINPNDEVELRLRKLGWWVAKEKRPLDYPSQTSDYLMQVYGTRVATGFKGETPDLPPGFDEEMAETEKALTRLRGYSSAQYQVIDMLYMLNMSPKEVVKRTPWCRTQIYAMRDSAKSFLKGWFEKGDDVL